MVKDAPNQVIAVFKNGMLADDAVVGEFGATRVDQQGSEHLLLLALVVVVVLLALVQRAQHVGPHEDATRLLAQLETGLHQRFGLVLDYLHHRASAAHQARLLPAVFH